MPKRSYPIDSRWDELDNIYGIKSNRQKIARLEKFITEEQSLLEDLEVPEPRSGALDSARHKLESLKEKLKRGQNSNKNNLTRMQLPLSFFNGDHLLEDLGTNQSMFDQHDRRLTLLDILSVLGRRESLREENPQTSVSSTI